jgi:RHS repeat-associated protein
LRSTAPPAARHASADIASPELEWKAYGYDGFGRLDIETGSAGPTATKVLYYDGQHIIAEASDANPDPNTNVGNDGNNITRWYTHSDTTDDLLAITPQAAPTGLYYSAIPSQVAHYSVHTDHQGSVRAVTDLTGGVVNSYAYDAYGNAEAAVESLPQRFRYTGREWDGVTRLYHYRARAYDPETGRFLQEDPLWFNAGDLNVYRYVGNNPVNAVDPSGMATASEYGIEASISVRVLTAGRMATQAMLSTGARTANYLKLADKNVLSSIAGGITCTLFILADAIEQADENTQIVGVDRSRCGVVAMSVPDDIPLFLTIKKPITIPNKSSCQKHLTLCMESTTWRRGNVFGTGQCVTCFDVCKNTGLWPYSTATGSCNYPGFIDD